MKACKGFVKNADGTLQCRDKTYVEPVCPFEWCEAEAVHYHRKGRTADFCACPCGLCDPDHLDSNDFATRCYAPRPGNAEPETDLSAQVARIRPGDQVTAEFEGVSPVKASGALLSDRDILAALDAGRIALDPFDSALVQPSSVDVRLHRFFRLFENHKYSHIDPAEDQPELTRLVEVDVGDAFVLHPGEFVLASTVEQVTLGSDIAARVEGKSSLGRLGLLTHATAGFVDPGFTGHVTLELSNVATLPIKLWPGMKIGQLCFFQLSSPAEFPYGSGELGSHYQGQRGPTASRSFENFARATLYNGKIEQAEEEQR